MSAFLDADAFEFPRRPVDDSPAELRAKNRALAEALVRLAHYARHLPICRFEQRLASCDCGLRESVDTAQKAHDAGVL